MKTLLTITTILFCFIATTASADHWVYIRLEDRLGVTSEDTKGRSKEGDIVDIRYNDYEPSAIEKSEWAIVNVSGLTSGMIAQYKEAWTEVEEGEKVLKAYRKYKLKNIWVRNLSKGIYPQTIDVSIVNNNIRVKVADDLALYERKRKVYAMLQPFKKVYEKIEYAWNYWALPAYASVSCADDSTSGEQICTINWTSQDYDSLTAWEDAKDGDIITATQIRTAHIYDDDGALVESASVSMAGWTADSTYYWNITAPEGERHDGTLPDGTAGDGALMTFDYNATYTNLIGFSETYGNKISWIAFKVAFTGTNSSSAVIAGGDGSAYDTITISQCIFKADTLASDDTTPYAISFYDSTSAWSYVEVTNSIIYDFKVPTSGGGGAMRVSAANYRDTYLYSYNNTIFNTDIGILSSAGGASTDNRVHIKNTIFNDVADEYTFSTKSALFSAWDANIGEIAEDQSHGTTLDSGTTDDVTASKLIQSGQNFETTVKVGNVVKNTTDTTYTYVTAVDSDTTLTVNDDIFVSGEAFTIYSSFIRDVTFANEGADDFHLGASETIAIDNGTDLGTVYNSNFDIDNYDRDTMDVTWDIGADEYVSAESFLTIKGLTIKGATIN